MTEHTQALLAAIPDASPTILDALDYAFDQYQSIESLQSLHTVVAQKGLQSWPDYARGRASLAA